MQRVAQTFTVVLVLALLGLLVWKTSHNSRRPDRERGRQPARRRRLPVHAPARRPPRHASASRGCAGKVVVLNFWQSYCPPCTHEAPVVSAAAKHWAGKGVVFVGVDEQDLPGAGDQVHARFDITYPVIADDGPLIGHYGVTGYPETFFIDKHGRVIPMPPNATGQVGHIIGAATPALLALGIRTALAPVKAAAMKPFVAVLAIAGPRLRPRLRVPLEQQRPSDADRRSRRLSSASTCHEPLDMSTSPLAMQMKKPTSASRSRPAGRPSRSRTTSSPTSARRCSPFRRRTASTCSPGCCRLPRSASAPSAVGTGAWVWSRNRRRRRRRGGGTPAGRALAPALELRVDQELARFDA